MGTVVNNRLEASTRGTDLLPGLHARVHDPLWLLARQWQLGELDGQDAGTPVQGALVTRAVPLAAWRPALTDQAGGAGPPEARMEPRRRSPGPTTGPPPSRRRSSPMGRRCRGASASRPGCEWSAPCGGSASIRPL